MKKIALSTALISILLTGSLMAADSVATSKEVMRNATKTAAQKANVSGEHKLVQEAIRSLEFTTIALENLLKSKPKEAKKNIELALGKLEAILSLKNSPKLLPIDNKVVVKNFIGTSSDIERIVKDVKELISDGKIQEARELLNTLQSEIVIITVNLPLVSYPDALKLASKYLIEDKPEEAKKILKLALNTFTEERRIIPIPLINAIELASSASDIAKKDKEQALKYLSAAHDELKKAKNLGYFNKGDITYKELHEYINSVEKEIKGPNNAEKLFENLVKKLNEFKNKFLSSVK